MTDKNLTLASEFAGNQAKSWADAADHEEVDDQGAQEHHEHGHPEDQGQQYQQYEQDAHDDQGHNQGYQPRPQAPIPNHGPWKAYIGNLSWDVTEGHIAELLGDQYIKDMHLVRDREDGKFKGYGYVELVDRESLEYTLNLNGQEFMGRPMKIDVAEERQKRGGFGNKRGGFNSRGPRQPRSPREHREHRAHREPRPEHNDSEYGPRGIRRQKPQQDFEAPAPSDGKERPKLQLKPRTVAAPPAAVAEPTPASAGSDEAPKKKANPFGAARPREDVLRERQTKPSDASPVTSPALKPSKPSSASQSSGPSASQPQSHQQRNRNNNNSGNNSGNNNRPHRQGDRHQGDRHQGDRHDRPDRPDRSAGPIRRVEKKVRAAPQVDDQGFTNVSSKKSKGKPSAASPTDANGADVTKSPMKRAGVPDESDGDAQAPVNQFDALTLEEQNDLEEGAEDNQQDDE